MVSTIERSVVRFSTLLIYLVTIIFHSWVSTEPSHTNWLGTVMVIPLITVFIYQRLFLKKSLLITFNVTMPKLGSIIIAMIIPIILGGIIQGFFFITKDEYFLFKDLEDIKRLVWKSFSILALSALLEEVVWRGNFFFHLRRSYTLRKTAVITAVIWSVWHLPIAIIYKDYENTLLGVVGYIGVLFIISIMLTYICVYGKSVLPAAFLHAGFNGFYFSEGINIRWRLEYLELFELLVLILSLGIFIIVYKLNKRCLFSKKVFSRTR